MKGLTPVEAKMLGIVIANRNNDTAMPLRSMDEQNAIYALHKRGLIVFGHDNGEQICDVRATPMGHMMHAISKVTT